MATSGNTISNNLIQNLGGGGFGYGIGVLIYNNFYADVVDNDIEGVRVGIQTGNFSNANPGSTASISGNEVSATRRGVFYNLHYSGATPFTVEANDITATDDPSAPGNAQWIGVLIASQQTAVSADFIDNTIDGSATTIATTAGYSVWNTPTVGDLNIIGGSVTGVDYGVWVNNFEGYNSDGGDTHVTVDGVEITAGQIGVYVLDSVSNTNGSSVTATITGNTEIIGASFAGIKVEGANASSDITGNNGSIHGNLIGIDVDGGSATIIGNHIYDNITGIRFINGGTGSVGGALIADGNNFSDSTPDDLDDDNVTDILVDASAGTVTVAANNTFAGDTFFVDNQGTQNILATGNTFDVADYFRVEDRTSHRVDNLVLGLVEWVVDNVYVTVPAMLSTDSSIQRGIDATLGPDWTVNVEAGAFTENMTVSKDIKIIGAVTGLGAAATTINTGNSNAIFEINGSFFGDDQTVEIKNLNLNGLAGTGYTV